jgi:branched-chain amino acid aminotransferase
MAKLFCCISPVGPYFPTGFKPVKVIANYNYVRAGPYGVGEFKVGGNYAPTI